MQQALTNALLMDAVVGSLQSSKAIYAASKLAHFDRIKMEGRDLFVWFKQNDMLSFCHHIFFFLNAHRDCCRATKVNQL